MNKMTWIIGASSLFGYGVVISDIQVTLANKKTIDVLQKAYPLSNFIVGGFAGSVRVGFMLLQSLSDKLKLPLGYEGYAWDPCKVANDWSIVARNVFASALLNEQKLGSKFLIIAASPVPDVGEWPQGWDSKIYMIRFSSPNFIPQIMVKRMKICSIGSGARVSEYKRSIRERLKLGIRDPILKAEVMNPYGWARTLAFSISRSIERYPQDGISKHLHLFTVRRGEIIAGNNNEKIYPKEGGVIVFKMPPVARNYQEFVSMLELTGTEASMAIC